MPQCKENKKKKKNSCSPYTKGEKNKTKNSDLIKSIKKLTKSVNQNNQIITSVISNFKKPKLITYDVVKKKKTCKK
jgi:hypothetical protein